jgi:hypothetical protein
MASIKDLTMAIETLEVHGQKQKMLLEMRFNFEEEKLHVHII